MREPGNRPLLLVLSVAIAGLLWFFVTVEHRGERAGEKVVDADVTYPPLHGLVILNPVEKVRLRLRGREADLRGVNPFSVDVRVDMPETALGSVDLPLDENNVRLPRGVELVSIEPSFLHLELDQEVRRLIPVRVQLVGEPAAGAVVLTPTVRPAELLVSGPASRVRQIASLPTSPISLDGHALDFEETTLVVSPDPLIKILQSPVVTAVLPMRPPGSPLPGTPSGLPR